MNSWKEMYAFWEQYRKDSAAIAEDAEVAQKVRDLADEEVIAADDIIGKMLKGRRHEELAAPSD